MNHNDIWLEKAKQEQDEYETYLRLQKKFNKQNWKPTVREDYSG